MTITKTHKHHQIVEKIIEVCDEGRMSCAGGYDTDWCIWHGNVIWADLDPGKEYQRTTLTIKPVDKFIIENLESLEDLPRKEFWKVFKGASPKLLKEVTEWDNNGEEQED